MARDWSDKSLDPRVTLYLPSGYGGGGFVIVTLGETRVVAEYPAGKVELLLAFNRALSADESLAEVVRGWRSPVTIASSLQYAIEEESLRRSVSLINRKFREAATESAPHSRLPSLLETKRTVGIRLRWPLTVLLPKLTTADKED